MPRFVLAPLVVAACAVGWYAVQRAWMRAFPGAAPDPDALAGRLGCHGGPRCDQSCERPPGQRCGRAKEEPS